MPRNMHMLSKDLRRPGIHTSGQLRSSIQARTEGQGSDADYLAECLARAPPPLHVPHTHTQSPSAKTGRFFWFEAFKKISVQNLAGDWIT